MKLVDTDFLIDRLREWVAGETGPATTLRERRDVVRDAVSLWIEHPRDTVARWEPMRSSR